MPILPNNPYTIYAIFKQNIAWSDWAGVFATNKNHFGIYANTNKIGVFNTNTYNSYTSDISALSYHVCALSFYNGLGCLYIDGYLKFARVDCIFPDIPYVIHSIADYKMICICDNVAHGSKDVLENTEYLAQKYGIEI